MDIVCALSGLIGLERSPKGILTIREGGFGSILLDMAMGCPAGALEEFGGDGRLKELPDSFGPLLEQCREHQMAAPVACAPYQLRTTKRDDLEGLLSTLAKESIKVCGQAGCQYLIVKPLFAGIAYQNVWETNRKYYLSLASLAKENHVTILLENQCRDVNGHLVRGICSAADEAAAWTDRLNEEAGEERFGFCMDVGVCNLCGQDMQDFAVSLGNRIKAVILRDNDGQHETSQLPFTCVGHGQFQTNWLGLIRGLREICFDGLLIMDFGSTAMALSQFLHPQLLRFAREIAEYFRWQISIKSVLKKYNTRVLFGAGNMCRNYMKCYGREFPPLYTCDNNKNRWGGYFEGLEIKPPEALKTLPSDCAIFICNIYYKEIENQLRRMGIANPVEYFNDEYMPSFYFDRLEYWEG